jgi:hypothetical protein
MPVENVQAPLPPADVEQKGEAVQQSAEAAPVEGAPVEGAPVVEEASATEAPPATEEAPATPKLRTEKVKAYALPALTFVTWSSFFCVVNALQAHACFACGAWRAIKKGDAPGYRMDPAKTMFCGLNHCCLASMCPVGDVEKKQKVVTL